MKKLLCFDMDMTLLNHNTWMIPENALQSIEQLHREHIIVIASGRDMDHANSIHLKNLVKPDAVVHCDGQKVTVGEKILYEKFFNTEVLKELLTFAEANCLCVGANIGEDACYINKEIIINYERQLFGACDKKFLPCEELFRHKLYSMVFIGHPQEARMIEEAFPMLQLPLFASNVGADIVDRDISKAVGIKAVLDHYHMCWEDTIAFGDSMNDMEMLKAAGVGIAMGNATEELKAAADYVTRDIDKDGICYALKEIVHLL